jgi:hypothetical protein
MKTEGMRDTSHQKQLLLYRNMGLKSKAVVEPGQLRMAPQCFFKCWGTTLALLLKTVILNIGGTAYGQYG